MFAGPSPPKTLFPTWKIFLVMQLILKKGNLQNMHTSTSSKKGELELGAE